MSGADIGIDIDVAIETAALTGVFVDLIEVTNIELPEMTTDEVEVTHMKSPNRTREFISGLKDPGEMTLELNWIEGNATDIELNSLKASGETRGIKITFPGVGGAVWSFSGYVKGYKPEASIGAAKKATVTIRVTGSVAIA